MSTGDLFKGLLAELALREGDTPAILETPLLSTPTFCIAADSYLLRVPNGLRFHYVRGEGVTVTRPSEIAEREIPVFLNGPVFGAVCWLNGMVALHASAVVHEDGVHAFTTRSGGGKSTLAAKLGQMGFALFSDDVLAVAPGIDGALQCFSLHKQLKLWRETVDVFALGQTRAVRAGVEKVYADAPGGARGGVLPLRSLYMLRKNHSHTRLSPIIGLDRMRALQAAIYRPRYANAALDHAGRFRLLSQLIALPLYDFERPLRFEEFQAGAACIADNIRASR